jgi:PadR family transcriptional regulator, regulatory protein PadR
MQEPTFLVLTVLAGPPLHGYGIMQAIGEVSGGTVAVRPGTLYAALDRLTHEGLVEVDREDEWADGRVRRYYRLTPQGSQTLRAEAIRRRELADVAVRRLAAQSRRPEAGPALSPAPSPA